jgi:predicted Zn finger-like uncharacterized protein
MFKVVPDQLRISEGWVRCGKCEEIFDASAHMQEVVAPENDASTPDDQDTVPFEGALAAAMASEAKPGRAGRPKARNVADVDLELHEGPDATVIEPVVTDADLLSGASTAGMEGRAEPVFAAEVQPAPVAVAPAPTAQLSFMRNATKTSRWHRPLVRATLMVTTLLLVFGLMLQWLVQERDRVAAVEPGLKPLIEEVCLLLGCQIEPLRQIDSVVIDSSAFSKIKGDLYRLSLTLKNNAPIDLAMPAIELSLTDTLDHALMRRVFLPRELGVTSGVIPAASETQTTLVLTVKANGNGERVAGYRLLAFYP